MATPGIRALGAVVCATLCTVLAAAGLASAAAHAPEAGTRVVSVRADCIDGSGVVSMRQVRHPSGTTNVHVAAHGVRNGPWRGSFTPDLDADSPTDVDIEATAADHVLQASLEVDDVGAFSGVGLMHRRHRADGICSAIVLDRPRLTVFGGAELMASLRHNTPGELRARASLNGCRAGSRWHTAVTAEYDDGRTVGWGGGGYPCKDGDVRFSFSTATTDATEYPNRVTFVARSSDGDVRRVSYRIADAG